MERMTELERKYVLEALDNEFATSRNSLFNNRLEQAFAERLGVRFAIGHVNGTATMHTALAALGVKPGDEVIVPPLTMSSTALAVLHNGSLPVFADVDSATFNLDAASVRARVTDRTRAVISVALYGLAPDYDALLAVCRERNLPLIEDNAECFLGKYKGALVGQQGTFASFSFQASKHITCGEGGMLTTDDEALADHARRFSCLGYAGVSAKQGKITRNDIQDPNYSRHVTLGFNYRMSEVTAAVALGQLERADELVANRMRVATIFDEAIAGVEYVQRQAMPAGYVNSYWSYSWVLQSKQPEKDWYAFRDLFQRNGGDGFYAAWKLSYREPLFLNEIQHTPGIRQQYAPGLCPMAEYLQPRMVQMKTNYWQLDEAHQQAAILKQTLHSFRPK
jgi:perosamine synthetase